MVSSDISAVKRNYLFMLIYGKVFHLADARFFASQFVDALVFDLESTHVSLDEIKQWMSWTEGIPWIASTSSGSMLDISQQIATLQIQQLWVYPFFIQNMPNEHMTCHLKVDTIDSIIDANQHYILQLNQQNAFEKNHNVSKAITLQGDWNVLSLNKAIAHWQPAGICIHGITSQVEEDHVYEPQTDWIQYLQCL